MTEIDSGHPSPVADVDHDPEGELPRRASRRRWLVVTVFVAALVLVVAAGGVAFALTRGHGSGPVPVTAGRSHEVGLPTLLISSVPVVGARQRVTPGCPERGLDTTDASQIYGGGDEAKLDLVNLGYRRGNIRCWASGSTSVEVVLLQFDTDIDAANFGTKVRIGSVESGHYTEHEIAGVPGGASYTRDVDPANPQRLTAVAVGHRGDILVQTECVCPRPVRPATVEQLLRAQLLQL